MEEAVVSTQSNNRVKLLKFSPRNEDSQIDSDKKNTPTMNTVVDKNVTSVNDGGHSDDEETTILATEAVNSVDVTKETGNACSVNEVHPGDAEEEEQDTERRIGQGREESDVVLRRKGEENNGIPPDGGWGWVVLAGSFVVMLLITAIGPCFGLVFSPIFMELATSPSTAFWIFSSFSLIWNLTSPVVGPLTKEFGHRCVAMVGAFLVTAALMVSAFATSSSYLFIFSIFGGIGAGILVTISNLIMPLYFTKHLGRANGILMTGPSISLFIAPHIISFLQENFNYQWAMLIFGAIFLNTFISAAVFHPVVWHSKIRIGCQKGCSADKELQQLCQKKSPMGRNNSQREKKHSSFSSLCNLLFRVCHSTILSLRILSNPMAFIIALSGTLTMNAYVKFAVMVPFVVEKHHAAQDSALCLSVAGICNLVARLIMSAMADCKKFNMRIAYVFSISLIALANLAFPFLMSLRWMMVTMGFWGYGVGSFMGLYNLVMIKYIGTKNLPAMFGSACLLNGIGFISIGPLLGWVRELTGSYSISMWMLTSIECICILLWLFMPSAEKWQFRHSFIHPSERV